MPTPTMPLSQSSVDLGSAVMKLPAGSFNHRRALNPHLRRSSWHTKQPCAQEADIFQLLLRNFLTELNCRMDLLESYGHLKYDAGIEYAYNTLIALREQGLKLSDGAIVAGRRQAAIFVDNLEERYQDVSERKETHGDKVLTGIVIMDSYLTYLETRAHALRGGALGAYAHGFYEGGLRRMDVGLELAKGVVDGGLDRARRAREAIEHTVDNAVQQALLRAKEHGLLHYDDLPAPWRVNPHIHKGYRFSECKWACVRSVISVHNELINIWTHLIGLVIVLALAFHFYPMSINFSMSTRADIIIAAVFFFAAVKCLICSTIWHTMNSISHQTLLDRFACVDYMGISLLVAASILTTEYAAFYCEPVSRWVYMGLTALLGVGGVILPWHPAFNRADMSWARVLFYVFLALTGFLPFGQLAYTRGIAWAHFFYAPLAKSLLVYIIGACLYASKTPERFFPGFFDYIGCSHNIWHLTVLAGIVFHYTAMQTMFLSALLRAQTDCSIY